MFEENNVDVAAQKKLVEDFLNNATDEEKEEISYLIALGQTKLIVQKAKEKHEQALKEAATMDSVELSAKPVEETQEVPTILPDTNPGLRNHL